jgi:hypothetical protein
VKSLGVWTGRANSAWGRNEDLRIEGILHALFADVKRQANLSSQGHRTCLEVREDILISLGTSPRYPAALEPVHLSIDMELSPTRVKPARPGHHKWARDGHIWTVVGRPEGGITPKFTIRDSTGQLYIFKLDPIHMPELPSSVEVISTKIFHALGYNVPEDYVYYINRSKSCRGPQGGVEGP